jgi:3-oxoacyl-[acyl-carrier protein] reductase
MEGITKMIKDKVALVTGGTRGIGKSIAQVFAANGAKVIFTYHSSVESAQEIEQWGKDNQFEIYGIQADASKFSDAEKSISFTLEKFNRLDILVNNAGITRDNLLLRMSEDEFDSVISANLKSVFNYTKCAVKPMISQRYGRVINISSVVGISGNPGQANYVAAKAGVIGFTKSVAKELASRNITVNAVAPGFIETDMTKKLNDKQKEAIISVIPLKKIGSPDVIAKAALFFASENADYITGQVLCVDGGMTM